MSQRLNAMVCIYVSGPYTWKKDSDYGGKLPEQVVKENIDRADEIGRILLNNGYIPFIPHTMMAGWEDEKGVPQDDVIEASLEWVRRCDALLFYDPEDRPKSDGAIKELKEARFANKPIFYISRVEEAASIWPFTDEQRQRDWPNIKLIEYRELMESYRHTYATIWQAGVVFAAFSAVLATVGARAESLIGLCAPMPLIFWFFGIFKPMNRYGEYRSRLLGGIEKRLNRALPHLGISHARGFNKIRKKKMGWHTRLAKGRWSVRHGVNLLGWTLVGVQIGLIILWIWRGSLFSTDPLGSGIDIDFFF